jgi:hypothetical protein
MRSAGLTILAIALILTFSYPAAAQGSSVAGDWEIIMISPVGQHPVKASLKLDGEKLLGLVKGEIGETPIEGTFTEKRVKIAFKVPYQGTDLLITLLGEIDGDSLKGTADYGGMAQGEWSGRRSGSAGATDAGNKPAEGEKIDVTGSWAFAVETPMGTGNPTFTFKQDGENLTGHYTGALGEADVTGTIKGNAITFSFKISAQGMEGVVTYSGTVEKDSIKGKAKFGDMGDGTFTAKRQ